MAELDHLFRMLAEADGSDLHLSAGRRPVMRVHGDMRPIDALPAFTEEQVQALLAEVMPERVHAEFERRHDADFSYEVPGVVRLRGNAYRSRRGVGAVFRVVPARIRTAEELNLPQAVRDFCHLSKGLVVVTGPTGSGKSTTLAAMVDLANRTRSEHIITIEDPIEFVHEDRKCTVTQREVHTHTESFAVALRAALREDPDIVLVGEMRDLETMQIAIETAETGHLVFATLHTNTAASTVDRIIDVFPADRQNQIRTMLASSLKGVISQVLCRRKGGGRVAALELLVVDSAVAAMIRDCKTFQIPSAMQVGRARGMGLMNDALFDLVRAGVVDSVEAYVKAIDKEDLVNRFKKAGIPFDHSRIGALE
jgi:twitching motility protein PilT